MSERDKDKKEVLFEGEVEIANAMAHIEGLLAGLKSGTISIQQGMNALTVHPAKTVVLVLKVKRKGEREFVSIELGWEKAARRDAPTGLRISDKEIPLVRAVEG